MEEMMGQAMRNPIVFAQFLQDYKKVFENYMPSNAVDDEQDFKTAEQNCSLQHLFLQDEPQVEKFDKGFSDIQRKFIIQAPEQIKNLKTFMRILKSKEKTVANPFKRSREIYKMAELPPRSNEQAENCEPYNELIITVRVYRPARTTHLGQNLETPVFAEEFECLGSNLLTELRDKISCICQKKRFFDISLDPVAELPEKKTDPSYFFINDTFYNDHRLPDNDDYSQVIRDWVKKAQGLQHLEFKTAKMEQTHFIELTASLGFPQLYLHHGNCEHVFVFSQLAVMSTKADCLQRQQYPYLRSFNPFNNRLCHMCSREHFVYIVENSKRQTIDPTYLCYKCHRRWNYVDGKKVGEFKAYRLHEFDAATESYMQNAEQMEATDTEQYYIESSIKYEDTACEMNAESD